MSHVNPESEFEEFVYLAERLCARFPALDEHSAFRLIADELESFDGVALRTYVPVLVENNLMRRLRAQSAVAPGRGDLLAS